MPVLVNTKMGVVPNTPAEPIIYPEQYHHTIVDSRYTPSTSLLSNVTGIPVLCEYYRQNLGGNEEQLGLQLDDIPTYQSYVRINNLILKFEQAPDFDYDANVSEASENVMAWAIYGLAPLLGDMFIRDVGDGHAGLYQIVANPQIKTYANDKVYEIECKLLGFVTQAIMDNLNSKVIEELYYSKDSALYGGNPVITQNDEELNKKLFNWMLEIMRYMFVKFYWNPEETFKLPNVCETDVDGACRNIYDPYLVKFLADTLPLRLIGHNKPINIINHQGPVNYGYTDAITVWDLFYREDWNLLQVIEKQMWLKDRRDFLGTRTYGTFFNTKFDAIVINDIKNYKDLPPPYITYNWYYTPETFGTEKVCYVFTESFYKGGAGNDFERLLLKVFRDKVIDKQSILAACEQYYKYPFQLQPYYGGLLVRMIIKAKASNAGYL